MSIFHTDPRVNLNTVKRVAELSWELGTGRDFDDGPCTKVVVLTVSHNNRGKRFIASAARADVVNDRPGVTVTKFSPISGTRVRLESQPAARYSAKAFEDAVQAALDELRSRADEPEVAAVADPTSPA